MRYKDVYNLADHAKEVLEINPDKTLEYYTGLFICSNCGNKTKEWVSLDGSTLAQVVEKEGIVDCGNCLQVYKIIPDGWMFLEDWLEMKRNKKKLAKHRKNYS